MSAPAGARGVPGRLPPSVLLGALLWGVFAVVVRPGPLDPAWIHALLLLAPLVLVPLGLALVETPISGGRASRLLALTGRLQLPAAAVGDLLAGNLYVNIHTSGRPGGEIRGQIVNAPQQSLLEIPTLSSGACCSWRSRSARRRAGSSGAEAERRRARHWATCTAPGALPGLAEPPSGA